MTVCPVFESILVVTGTQRQDTVFAFSCLLTTQCSMTSADEGGSWLRIRTGGGGCGFATCLCFAAQPSMHKIKMSQQCFTIMDTDTSHNITLPPTPIYIIKDAAIAGSEQRRATWRDACHFNDWMRC